MANEKKDNEKKPITFILLDESFLFNDLRVILDGVDIKQFKRNAVMFYYHKDQNLPIGRWVNVRKENGQLLADAEFDYADPDPEVQRIIGKVERGFLRMASCDLRDLILSDDEKYKIKGQKLPSIIKCRVREASIVPIGGNHNAFRLFDAEGTEIDLTDTLKLSDLINPHNKQSMNKQLLSVLQLADNATDEDVTKKVQLLLSDNAQLKKDKELLVTDKETLTTEKEELQTKLDAIALADKEAQTAEFEADLELAAKDGRVDFDKEGKTKERWLKLFDISPEDTRLSLAELPKRESPFQRLSDDGGTKGAWEKRQAEIAANSKAAENR